ncbi:MAG: hypothetical protein K0S71_565 [Clostridia bacterium]|nr:hypothetical protein [Clostridia bacterium]
MKKLTIEQLIGAKDKKDKFKVKEVYIESLDGSVLIQKCKDEVILNAMDSITKNDNVVNMVQIFKELIYKSIPLFKNDELLKAYEVAEPIDIVSALLELGEIMTVGNEILKLYGFDGLEDEIKN